MSKWITLDQAAIRRHFRSGRRHIPVIPDGGGCYAIYANDRVLYVGSTHNLTSRLHEHVAMFGTHEDDVEIGVRQGSHGTNGTASLTVRKWGIKVRPARFYGEWGTLELRLLRRLNPPRNKLRNR